MSSDYLYRSDAAVGENDRPGVPEVVFYQVKHRFVDQERSIPEESAEIMYYTLAIGHHTGIIDASEERLRCSLDLYRQVCTLLPEGEARYKLEAVLRGGEVYIDKFHRLLLTEAVDEALANASGGAALNGEAEEPGVDVEAWVVSAAGDVEAVALADAEAACVVDTTDDADLETAVEEAIDLDQGPRRVSDPKDWLRVFRAMLDLMKLNPAASITGRRRGA